MAYLYELAITRNTLVSLILCGMSPSTELSSLGHLKHNGCGFQAFRVKDDAVAAVEMVWSVPAEVTGL